ncbi:MAG: hypothetical protein U1A27_04005 [Phycisphaerae bacterium]
MRPTLTSPVAAAVHSLHGRPLPRAGAVRHYGSPLRPAFFTEIFNN